MVKIMENPIKMDDLGGTSIFEKHPYMEHGYPTVISYTTTITPEIIGFVQAITKVWDTLTVNMLMRKPLLGLKLL